jgi:hypothetical protein
VWLTSEATDSPLVSLSLVDSAGGIPRAFLIQGPYLLGMVAEQRQSNKDCSRQGKS